ncbi:MAG: ImmA/IrrE family metallo-endopeptidase [Candidatus Pacebacteria bacterium]|nr:ImmA/IrrE family metallo-endopeptidase [Candidatus Paceibacterota bacterium]
MPEKPEPIRIDRFVEKRFNLTIQYEQLPEGLLGYSRFGIKGVEAVVITQSLDEEGTVSAARRVRTTIAHEAGHCLLHAHLFATQRQSKKIFESGHDATPRVLCRDNNQELVGKRRSYQGDWWEYQANMVMSSLLMPRVLVQKAIRPYLEIMGELGSKREEAVAVLAEIFDVNPVVARIRLSDLYR